MRSSSAGCGCLRKRNSARSARRQGVLGTARPTGLEGRTSRRVPPLERLFQIARSSEPKEGYLRAHSLAPHWSNRRAIRRLLRLRLSQDVPGARPYRLRFAKDLRRRGRESPAWAQSTVRTCRNQADRTLRRDRYQGPALSSAKRLLWNSCREALELAKQPSRAPKILPAFLRKHASRP